MNLEEKPEPESETTLNISHNEQNAVFLALGSMTLLLFTYVYIIKKNKIVKARAIDNEDDNV